MPATLVLLLLGSLAGAEPGIHEKGNPLYKQLRTEGIAIGAKQHWSLPAPVMADGLNAAAQKAVLKALLADDIDLDSFLDSSLEAPQLLHRSTEKRGDPAAPARGLDLYFVVHGDLNKLADRTVLETLLVNERRPVKPRPLTREDLNRRGISQTEEAVRQEFFGYMQANIMVRVQVRAVNRTFWSRSADSILVATVLDDRFAADAEFPNQWLPLIKENEDDPVKEGPPQPYRGGAGNYAKMTRLKEPAGAFFVEAHIVFTEPQQWFGSENVLRSKLPPATKWLIRNIRQKMNRLNRT